MTPCVYDGSEPSQPFSPDFDYPVCRRCGIRQHEALERIAQMVRPVRWRAPPEIAGETDP